MSLRPEELWIMATAVCAAVACSIPGCFLVLRRMSLLGDAISHAVLPGLAVAFILSGTRDVQWMLLGALAMGLLTAVLIDALNRWGRIPEDSAMGVVFSSMFALGVILVNKVARDVDLDPGCVLYGLIELTPFDMVAVFGIEAPRALVWLAGVLLAAIVLVIVFFKELKIVAFDPYLATSMGISAVVVHYALMGWTAATTVVSFEAVGSILVVSMLIAPAAAAHLLTDKLGWMLIVAAVLAATAAVLGYLGSLWLNTSVAGMMSVVAGLEFGVAVIAAPRYGLVSKLVQRAMLTLRICREDILGLLFRLEERSSTAPGLHTRQVVAALRAGAPPPLIRLALFWLLRRGKIARIGTGELALTGAGRNAAGSLVRSHRLWESFLAHHSGLPLDHLHPASERMEHFITPALQSGLRHEHPGPTDPHGRDIPQAGHPDAP